MGIKSTTPALQLINGIPTVIKPLTTSVGAADSGAVPALNASGVLDSSIVNATPTSTGVSDAGKVIALDATGKLSSTMLPVGFGTDSNAIIAFEALSAGDYVNVFSNAGAFNVRRADASVVGKHAMGFVLAATSIGTLATVYFEGSNTAVTGQVVGNVFLSQTTVGAGTPTAPTSTATTGISQLIGYATSATSVNFQSHPYFVLN